MFYCSAKSEAMFYCSAKSEAILEIENTRSKQQIIISTINAVVSE